MDTRKEEDAPDEEQPLIGALDAVEQGDGFIRQDRPSTCFEAIRNTDEYLSTKLA